MTNERAETHACDCISRQVAIDALDVLRQEHRYRIPGKRETYSQYNEAWQDALGRAEGAIGNLPSAQPEIIYCKKCEHWTRTYGDEQWGLGDCDVFDKHLVRCNGYCAWAERRTDENNNE